MEGFIIALFVCLILALISKYLSIPAIPFYIIAGVILGKTGLGIVHADEISRFFSDMGLLFLLFFMGLELKLDRIIANPQRVLTGGLIGLSVDMGIGFTAAYLLGFTLMESFIVGAAFYITSTAIIITSLIENRKLMSREAETIIWVTVFEDIVLIFILAVLSASDQNLLLFFVKIALALVFMYAVSFYGKEFLVSILERDDEIPILFTFAAVLTTAAFAIFFGIPQTLMVIALGAAFATTDPDAFEQHARPFRDVFMVMFFVFFGVTIDFTSGVDWFIIAVICTLAVVSKLISGMIIGVVIHGSTLSGLEIWANMISRGEFSIALAVLYGSPVIATTIAAMVIFTSIVGAFTAKYSTWMRKCIISHSRRKALMYHPHNGR
ncbi:MULTISPECIES: cation:proton antiporter [unclassified Methanoregula]|uniref:cation:proton antiporter n=1 Tax=unclassified Methanoregula TaxID=2649730 RepID=UPI0009CDE7E4|nr:MULTISPECIES: cation:proton antiporter [unclassified Methanoregula]OPX61747.1 MAG: glutathione-regulated potassium-efflux system protein KefC [Methanoregula sp. PtaB.Bin085]OPY33944.1 MAG: glutathione-regulated potassium-efflux system protein KefC [Methanoregula sp. PtaU1.Bin006]